MPNLLYLFQVVRSWRIDTEDVVESKVPSTPVINMMTSVEVPEKKPKSPEPPVVEVLPKSRLVSPIKCALLIPFSKSRFYDRHGRVLRPCSSRIMCAAMLFFIYILKLNWNFQIGSVLLVPFVTKRGRSKKWIECVRDFRVNKPK